MILKAFVRLVAMSVVIGQSATAFAHDYKVAIADLVESEIRDWAQVDEVVNAIREQNKLSTTLSQADIDARDRQWREEVKVDNHKMIKAVLSNSLSSYLKSIKTDSHGKYTEIIVMDKKGLNVGQSDITSDYWQGDEDKWLKSYGAGPKGVLITEVDFDDSQQDYFSQVSISIVDPATYKAIGAVTVSIDIGKLE
ncbi:hypothetical protein [Sneathiella litorea]|uniref:Uncharacterized protein n=1 Tax=Sneathiella litorea TaxID=2606216 RepID=A0A6L8WC57_9PROT|nr:hypothetical protein [Sneathiella litorea]MZR32002.1 hypothetical protein [Sneathiella litorea]